MAWFPDSCSPPPTTKCKTYLSVARRLLTLPRSTDIDKPRHARRRRGPICSGVSLGVLFSQGDRGRHGAFGEVEGGGDSRCGTCEWQGQGWLGHGLSHGSVCCPGEGEGAAWGAGRGRAHWCAPCEVPRVAPLAHPPRPLSWAGHRAAAAPTPPRPVGPTNPPELKILLILLCGKRLQRLFLRNPTRIDIITSLFKQILDIFWTLFPGDMWTEASCALCGACWLGWAFWKGPESLRQSVSEP